MKRDSLIFAVILLLITIILLKVTMAYPLRSKLFPLIALVTILILLIIQIVREALALKEKESAEKIKAKTFHSKNLAIWGWLVTTLIMLWVLGFMGTVVLLPFLYLRFCRESWLISITLPLGCGVFFYTLFGLALSMPLYPGIFFSKFFG
jgi:hypothetical protein